eukprot:GHRR01005125.1.p1 GENE.GHRR01005125.1~~GHRR01005125.1.p1  ORF type:complete len:196 (+),score=77.08 GHRR01005125.1:170-757(+)
MQAKVQALAVPAGPVSADRGSVFTQKSASSRFKVYDLLEEAPPKTIHEAAERGDCSFIVKTIERTIDFDVNQQDKTGRTALHWAAECNQVEAAKTLIDYGCEVQKLECMGRTAVHMAARAAGADMLSALLNQLPEQERTELINMPDKSGITPVFLAYQRAEEGQSCFEYLMAHGARYNQQQLEEHARQQAQHGSS